MEKKIIVLMAGVAIFVFLTVVLQGIPSAIIKDLTGSNQRNISNVPAETGYPNIMAIAKEGLTKNISGEYYDQHVKIKRIEPHATQPGVYYVYLTFVYDWTEFSIEELVVNTNSSYAYPTIYFLDHSIAKNYFSGEIKQIISEQEAVLKLKTCSALMSKCDSTTGGTNGEIYCKSTAYFPGKYMCTPPKNMFSVWEAQVNLLDGTVSCRQYDAPCYVT